MAKKNHFVYRGGKSEQSRQQSAERTAKAANKLSKSFENSSNTYNGASISQSGHKQRGRS